MSEADFLDAKAFLLKASDKTGLNVYDHLSNVITKLLDERPDNAADLLEVLSAEVKKEQFVDNSNTVRDKPSESGVVALAKLQNALFREDEKIESDEPIIPNVQQIASRFAEGTAPSSSPFAMSHAHRWCWPGTD
jgi:radial spoke head protein 4A